MPHTSWTHASRRDFLNVAAVTGTGLLFAGFGSLTLAQDQLKKDTGQEDVSPSEDLMREHGVLKRILLVYAEAIRRIDANQELPPASLADSARMIRNFIEDYHEKLEEDFLFPRFRKANQLVDLVDILLAQHQAGRKLTDLTLQLATAPSLRDPAARLQLRDSLARFIRMYSPHEAREDTVLFPAFRKLVSANEYDALGDDFEKKEHELFGEDGFAKMVDGIAAIEKTLGIYDLAQFTPHI